MQDRSPGHNNYHYKQVWEINYYEINVKDVFKGNYNNLKTSLGPEADTYVIILHFLKYMDVIYPVFY